MTLAHLKHFTQAFAQWAEVVSIEQASVMVDLNARSVPVPRIRVEFQTPTELKTARVLATADFSVYCSPALAIA